MPVPLKGGDLQGSVLHDEDANPIDSVLVAGVRRLAVDASVVVAANFAIDGNIQIQTIETTVALGGGATFTGTEHDNIQHETFAVSLTLIGGGIGTNVDVIFEQSSLAAGTKRVVDTVNLVVAAGVTVPLDRGWSITRQFGRIRVVNNTANALATTEVTVVRKPIS